MEGSRSSIVSPEKLSLVTPEMMMVKIGSSCTQACTQIAGLRMAEEDFESQYDKLRQVVIN